MCNRSCYTCKYKRNVPGDTHIQCKYPLMNSETSSILFLASMANPVAFNIEVERMFGFTGDIHGLRSGWFCFPENFDTTWMQGECKKHSDLVDEAVQYQIILDTKLKAYYVLLQDIENGEKDKEQFQEVLDSYELAVANVTKASQIENRTEEDNAAARNQLVLDLNVAYELLEKVEMNL